VLQQGGGLKEFEELSDFRTGFYGCLTARADAFFDLTEALLCADAPSRTPVELSLSAEHRRGYGSLYAALNDGRLDTDQLRDLLAAQPLPRFEGGRIALGVDVSAWLRSDAACSPGLFCHVHGAFPQHRADHPGLAVLPGRGPVSGSLVVDRGPGRGAPGSRG
jgi:hypothetical protein